MAEPRSSWAPRTSRAPAPRAAPDPRPLCRPRPRRPHAGSIPPGWHQLPVRPGENFKGGGHGKAQLLPGPRRSSRAHGAPAVPDRRPLASHTPDGHCGPQFPGSFPPIGEGGKGPMATTTGARLGPPGRPRDGASCRASPRPSSIGTLWGEWPSLPGEIFKGGRQGRAGRLQGPGRGRGGTTRRSRGRRPAPPTPDGASRRARPRPSSPRTVLEPVAVSTERLFQRREARASRAPPGPGPGTGRYDAEIQDKRGAARRRHCPGTRPRSRARSL